MKWNAIGDDDGIAAFKLALALKIDKTLCAHLHRNIYNTTNCSHSMPAACTREVNALVTK